MTEMTVLCLAPDCVSFGNHTDTCTKQDCRGCVPRRAADGLRLCAWHRDRLTEWPLEAAELYADLGLMLTRTGTPGEKVRSTPDRGLTINDAAVTARATIRHQFVAWCRLIHEERGHALPGGWRVQELPLGFIGPPNRAWVITDTIPAMSRYLTRNADWLAAHDLAADAATEFRDMARGEARRIAYPSGARKFQVRTPDGTPVPCPQPTDDGACPGHLWTILRRVDALLPSQLACSHDETHTIPASEWIRMGRKLMRHAGTDTEVA